MNNLDNYGFLHINNVYRKDELEYGLSCIKENGTKIDYTILQEFIDTVFIGKLSSILGWDAQYLKYRFSNKQNAKDAATFHGDLYNHTDSNIIPIFTGLIYFDESDVELIPHSHKSHKLKQQENITIKTYETYSMKQKLHIVPGDFLLFHANIHHRGLFYDTANTSNRRLLQVFEIFPNRNIYELEKEKVLSVLTGQTQFMKMMNSINYELSKHKASIDTITYTHYFLMYNDLQYKITLSDISDKDKKGKYVGYVPGLYGPIIPNTLQDCNINIIHKNQPTIVPSHVKQNIVIAIIFIGIFMKFLYPSSSKKIRGRRR